jgi:hypothetical protein
VDAQASGDQVAAGSRVLKARPDAGAAHECFGLRAQELGEELRRDGVWVLLVNPCPAAAHELDVDAEPGSWVSSAQDPEEPAVSVAAFLRDDLELEPAACNQAPVRLARFIVARLAGLRGVDPEVPKGAPIAQYCRIAVNDALDRGLRDDSGRRRWSRGPSAALPERPRRCVEREDKQADRERAPRAR